MHTLFAAFAAFALATAASAAPVSDRACPRDDAVFTTLPADLTQVAGIVPLGNLNPKSNHVVPTRHIYVYPKMAVPGDPSTAVTLKVVAPGKADIVAVEYNTDAKDWSLHMRPCKDVALYYFHIKSLDLRLQRAIGPMTVGSITAPGLILKPVSIPVSAGQFLGTAKTFDIGVTDFRKPALAFANPARYAIDMPLLLSSSIFTGDPAIAALVAPRVVPQALYNRCPIDYFTPVPRGQLDARLSNFDGTILASGTPKCHSHMQDVPKTAQGNWWFDTDPTHDAIMSEDKAIALVNWNVNPTVQLFSLTRTTPGLTATLLDPPGAAGEDLAAVFEFPVREGPQRTNRRFKEITDGAIYCYDLIRVHRGPRAMRGVILVQVADGPGGPRSQLNFEIIRTSRCPALPLPWTFGSGMASFHR